MRALRVIDWGALVAALGAATLTISVGLAVLARLDAEWPRAAFDALPAVLRNAMTVVIPAGLGGIFFGAVLVPLDRTEWYCGAIAGALLAALCAHVVGGFDVLTEASSDTATIVGLCALAGALAAATYNLYDEGRPGRFTPSP